MMYIQPAFVENSDSLKFFDNVIKRKLTDITYLQQ